jgi:hypothetical protein
MPKTLDPFRFLLISVAGWMNQHQQHAIEYLREENRVLRAQLGNRRLRFTDDQRRSLAAKAKLPGRRLLAKVATVATPETLLHWHRKLIANKYDGSARRNPGRPATGMELEALVVRMAMENRVWGYLRSTGTRLQPRTSSPSRSLPEKASSAFWFCSSLSCPPAAFTLPASRRGRTDYG